MGTFNTESKNTFGAIINTTLSDGYKSSSNVLGLEVTFTPPIVPNDSLAKETNFYVETNPDNQPANLVSGGLQIKFLKSQLDANKHVGFRLSSTTAAASFICSTETTDFSATGKPIAVNTSSPVDSFIWATALSSTLTADGDGYIVVDAVIDYTGSTPNDSSTFSVDVFEVDNTTSGTPVSLGSVSTTSTDVNLSITVYSANITSEMSSLDPTDFSKTKTSFLKNDSVVLKAIHTTNTAAGYKPISKLVIDETVTSNISAKKIYMSINQNISSEADLIGDTTTTVAIDLTQQTLPAGVTYTNGVIQVTMQYIADTGYFNALFTGTGNTLPNLVYAYVFGNIVGLGA